MRKNPIAGSFHIFDKTPGKIPIWILKPDGNVPDAYTHQTIWFNLKRGGGEKKKKMVMLKSLRHCFE